MVLTEKLKLMLLFVLSLVSVSKQECTEPMPGNPVRVLETYQSDHIIFVMDTYPHRTQWSINVLHAENLGNGVNLESYFKVASVNSSNTLWQIRLIKPLDVEEMYNLTGISISSLQILMLCLDTDQSRKNNYTRLINVIHVSEFIPKFKPNITLHIAENSSVGQPCQDLRVYITDRDVPPPGISSDIHKCSQNEYTGTGVSGYDILVADVDCQIVLKRALDFETGPTQYFINITVEDTDGLRQTSILEVSIDNTDDGPPVFVCNKACSGCGVGEYAAYITPYITGTLRKMIPYKLEAIDPDLASVNYTIISSSPPESARHVTIDATSGELDVVVPFIGLPISLATYQIQVKNLPMTLKPGLVKSSQQTLATLALIIIRKDGATPRELSVPGVVVQQSNRLVYLGIVVLLSACLGSILASIGCILHVRKIHYSAKRSGEHDG